ncbi:Ribose import ATP-binding protein RbsA [Roseibaca ekhonensis]|uniref:Ribose import ATP-binding protein RbsA n=1 Tax=Roseinatronobacter ekhonensis TaxID=254356 RepID=A0A3B0M745_9RHOB|nr:sugar ABC transporter ATP-binding protein [Roseibaca ekhonensis]SUZ31815.1 Ribose import ATP-binding protein RbsA [Roseibaca ekhonensis]
MTEAALSLQEIVKTFPGVRALDSASLTLQPSEIHGLVGENGAGKSTIIKVLAGIYTPDSGQLRIAGQHIHPITPASVHDAGIRFIHQELHLVPHFTVAEAIFMGQELAGPFGLRKGQMRHRAEEFLHDRLGVTIHGNRLVRDLGTAERKLVQIARALIDGQAKVVVFDEPTAPLASAEVKTLMDAIFRLKQQEITILYVSHYLNEIMGICDRVTVFRNGRNVAVFDDVDDALGPKMISAMVGRDLDDIYPARTRSFAETVMTLDKLTGPGFEDVSLSLRKGEILGVAGLIGSGREELVDTLYGLARAKGGTLHLHGKRARIRTPSDAIAQGVVLVPRDRRNDGLVLPMTVGENITLATLDEDATFGVENRAHARTRAARKVSELDIRPANTGAIVRFLSGGNQQKVVLARWLARDADIFVLDEPTVGVDIGARAEIYSVVNRLAQDGAGVLVSSSDPGELIGLCDRILVMLRGRVVAELDPARQSMDDLIALSTGATNAPQGQEVPV